MDWAWEGLITQPSPWIWVRSDSGLVRWENFPLKNIFLVLIYRLGLTDLACIYRKLLWACYLYTFIWYIKDTMPPPSLRYYQLPPPSPLPATTKGLFTMKKICKSSFERERVFKTSNSMSSPKCLTYEKYYISNIHMVNFTLKETSDILKLVQKIFIVR